MDIPKGIPRLDLPKATTLDRIYAWYMQPDDMDPADPAYVELTPKEELQKNRYKVAFALMLDNKMDHEIAEHIAAYFGVSQRQGYRDVVDAKKLYPDINKSSKIADRYLLTQYLMQCFNLAKTVLDVQQMIKAIVAIGKIKGLDKDDPDLPDPETFKPHTYNISVNLPGGKNQLINLDAISKMPAHEFEQVMKTVQDSDLTDAELIKLLNESAGQREED